MTLFIQILFFLISFPIFTLLALTGFVFLLHKIFLSPDEIVDDFWG